MNFNVNEAFMCTVTTAENSKFKMTWSCSKTKITEMLILHRWSKLATFRFEAMIKPQQWTKMD